MTAPATQFSVVLLGRFPGRDKAVAAALARDFAHDEAWGMQIIGAAPIVLLDGLSAEQAQAIYAALADVENSGSRLEVQPGLDPGLPKLGWPVPARIKGRLVTEYAPVAAAPAPAAPAPAAPTAATLIVPCPYTGQRIKLTITVSVERATSQAAPGATAVAPPVPIPVPMPAPHFGPTPPRPPTGPSAAAAAAYRGMPTPVGLPSVPLVRPTLPAGPPAAVPPAMRRLTPGAGGPVQPSAPAASPVIEGLEDLDELQPMSHAPLPAADHAGPPLAARPPTRMIAPPQPRPSAPLMPPVSVAQPGRKSGPVALRPPAPSSAPLPDVPVLQNPPAAVPSVTEALGGQDAAHLPFDLMNAPMDLSAFEARVSASGILRAAPAQPVPPASAAAPASSASAPAAEAAAEDDGSLWSVFMGKCGIPKVHQAVAELQGISVQEAAKLCQKPVVAVAKDVPGAAARNIRQQFAAMNVSVRLTRRN